MREKGWEERGPKAHSKNSDFGTPIIWKSLVVFQMKNSLLGWLEGACTHTHTHTFAQILGRDMRKHLKAIRIVRFYIAAIGRRFDHDSWFETSRASFCNGASEALVLMVWNFSQLSRESKTKSYMQRRSDPNAPSPELSRTSWIRVLQQESRRLAVCVCAKNPSGNYVKLRKLIC